MEWRPGNITALILVEVELVFLLVFVFLGILPADIATLEKQFCCGLKFDFRIQASLFGEGKTNGRFR